MFVDALLDGAAGPEAWAAHAWALLKQQGHRLKKDDKRLDTDEDNLAEMTRQATAFADGRLPILRRLRCIG